jgi:hypothetical protein
MSRISYVLSKLSLFLGPTGDWKRQVVRRDQRDQIPLTLYTVAPLTSFSVPISGFVSRAKTHKPARLAYHSDPSPNFGRRCIIVRLFSSSRSL